MTRIATPLTAGEQRQIVQLLRRGQSVAEVSRRTGRSAQTVRQLRIDAELPPVGSGRLPRLVPVEVEDDEESGRPSRADPWIPPRGHDPYAERPDQRRWLALIVASTPAEQRLLRSAMCSVLGVSGFAADDLIELKLIADRRTAEQLAGLYLRAAGAS